MAVDKPALDPFSVLLRRYRLRCQLTQEALSQLTEISVRSIRALETGSGRAPRSSTLTRLANVLNLDAAERMEFAAAGQHAFWAARSGGQGRTAPLEGHLLRSSLPAAPGGFVGRDGCLKQLTRLLTARDVLSAPAAIVAAIVGQAGVGKTALAVQWAHDAAENFPDGCLFADLRGFSPGLPREPLETLRQLLAELGISPERIPDRIEDAVNVYRDATADRKILLILDNARSEEQVRPLLPVGRHSMTIVTSRHNLSGLVVHANARRLTLQPLSKPESVQLLRHIIGSAAVDADPVGAHELAEACQQLPLVIRIAAVLLLDRPDGQPRQLADEIRHGNPVKVLTLHGDPDSCVRTVMDHSYQALPLCERRAVDLIGLFPGGDLSAEDLAAMHGCDTARGEVMLRRLAAANLAQPVADGRYRCHDLVRSYAEASAENLTAAQRAAAFAGLYTHYLKLVDGAARVLYPQMLRLATSTSDDRPLFDNIESARARLDTERLNLLAALRHAARQDRHQTVILLADALRGYFWLRHDIRDWLDISTTALASARACGDRAGEVSALISAALAWHCAGSYAESARLYEASLPISSSLGWLQAHGTALGNLGVARVDQGRAAEAVELMTRSMQIYQDLGNEAGQAVLHGTLGVAHRILGDLGKARQHLLTAVELHTRHGSQGTLMMSTAHLGDTYRLLGDTERAATHLHEAKRLALKLGRPLGEAVAGYYLAALHLQLGDHDTARVLAMQALDAAQVTDNSTIAYALNTLGFIHLQTHEFDLSESCYTKAFNRTQSGGEPHPRILAIIGLAHNAMHRNQLDRAGELISSALSQSRVFQFRLCEAEARAAEAALNCARQALESAHAPP